MPEQIRWISPVISELWLSMRARQPVASASFYSGKNYKIGEVHRRADTMDYMVQEQTRHHLATAVSWRDHQISLIDTPGHVDFTAEVERSLRVLDSTVALFCAVGGVRPRLSRCGAKAKYEVPKLCMVNKMDRIGVISLTL